MTYARARLWLGISGVGAWVLIASLGIYGQWGLSWSTGTPANDFALWIAIYVLVQSPFDWLGGVYLPRRYGRTATTLAAWAKGVLVQAACWWLASLAVFAAGHYAGLSGALAMMALWIAALAVAQEWLARAVGNLTTAGRDGAATLLASSDPGFVGGWAGIGPTRRLLMPARWHKEWRAVQHTRRQGVLQLGSRAMGLTVAVAFNLAGLAVSAALTPGAGFESAGAYLHLVFGFTLWSFLGLLVLPSISRPAVFQADRFAEARGIAWRDTARHLDQLQDDEPARTPWVERIFHPVPTLAARLKAPHPTWGAWQAARIALYLSWAVPGLLARSVHCNAGRPDLWVLFPGD